MLANGATRENWKKKKKKSLLNTSQIQFITLFFSVGAQRALLHQPRHKLCNYAEPPKPFSWTKHEDFDFSSSNFYTAGSHSTDHTAGDSLSMRPCSRNLTWDSWVESRESGRNPEKGLFTALQQWGPLQASPKHSQIVFLLTIPCFWLGR